MKNQNKKNIVVKSIYLDHREECSMSHTKIKVSSACSGALQINTSEISIVPTVNRYFYILNSNLSLTNGAIISSNLFSDDNGNPVTEFAIYSPNGYTNLYINGLIQESGIYNITTNSLAFIPQQATIFRGTPIIIESLGFSAKVN
ncbi:DUF4183 domain-containing protein [Lysinibacillus sp. NPDC097287]|uniref:DUF4183 domain-containing protein n=1 Tax=Lysinibacillus sp. NPDC097287 TaxID=3364144 RepID=UPI0037F5DFAA